MMIVSGKNVFNELKKNYKKIKKVYLANNFKDQDIINFIKEKNIPLYFQDYANLDRMIDAKHQGIVMEIKDYEYKSHKDMLDEKVVIMLDHIQDPHNFGAIIRTCEAAGITSIIIPKDRSISVTSTVMTTSSGALENVDIAVVSNLVNTIKEFQKNGFFVYGADMNGKNYKDFDFDTKTLLIIGNEGSGMSRLVKENCDEIISIPQYGTINSLNASVAAGIIIYGIVNR